MIMKRISKQWLRFGSNDIELPEGFEILSVQRAYDDFYDYDRNEFYIWYLFEVENEYDLVPVFIDLIETGEDIGVDDLFEMWHIDTVQLKGSSLVFHAFLRKPKYVPELIIH